jgi:hypothetical protein
MVGSNVTLMDLLFLAMANLFVQVYSETLRLGNFAANLENFNALYAEVMGVITGIYCVVERNWRILWIETDSNLVSLAFNSPSISP